MSDTPPMREAEFQRTVIEMAQRFKWRVGHFSTASGRAGGWFTPVQGDAKGFPDLTLLRNGRLVVVELKSQKGSVSPEQWHWLRAWEQVGAAEVFVWRPSMLGEIEKVLR